MFSDREALKEGWKLVRVPYGANRDQKRLFRDRRMESAPFKLDPPPTRVSGTTPVPRSAASPIVEEGAIFPRSLENNVFSVNTMKLMIQSPVKQLPGLLSLWR